MKNYYLHIGNNPAIHRKVVINSRYNVFNGVK